MQSCLDAVKGAVILTFGAGNGPDKNEELMQVFKKASDRGVLMLNITQCLKGEVEAAYATGTVSIRKFRISCKYSLYIIIYNIIACIGFGKSRVATWWRYDSRSCFNKTLLYTRNE